MKHARQYGKDARALVCRLSMIALAVILVTAMVVVCSVVSDGRASSASESANPQDVSSSLLSESDEDLPPVEEYGQVDVYRVVSLETGDVVYTENVEERDTLLLAGWKYEGVAWSAPEMSSTPVWRFLQPDGTHVYTASESVRAQFLAMRWKEEGVAWYSDDNHQVPVVCSERAANGVRTHCKADENIDENTASVASETETETAANDVSWWALNVTDHIPTHPVTILDGVDYAPVYDYAYYLVANPDVAAAYGNDDKAALEHYVLTGMGEGRAARENTDAETVSEYAMKAVKQRAGNAVGAAVGTGVFPINGYQLDSDTEAALKKGIRAVGADCAFVMVDLISGKGVGYNIDQTFYSASTLKGPYMASIARYAAADQEDLDLMEKVLWESDNDAYKTLYDRYGGEYMSRWYEESGAASEDSSLKYANISARNLALLWVSMADWFLNDEHGAQIAQLYTHPNVSPIHSTLGSKYETLSKAGWYSEAPLTPVINDAGIVEAGERPYVMVVLTNVRNYQFGRLTTLIRALDTAHDRQ